MTWFRCFNCGSYERSAECVGCGDTTRAVAQVAEPPPGVLHDLYDTLREMVRVGGKQHAEWQDVLIVTSQRSALFIVQPAGPESRTTLLARTGESGRNWAGRVAGKLETAFEEFVQSMANIDGPVPLGLGRGPLALDGLRRAWCEARRGLPVSDPRFNLFRPRELASAYSIELVQAGLIREGLSRTAVPHVAHILPRDWPLLPTSEQASGIILQALLLARQTITQLPEPPQPAPPGRHPGVHDDHRL